MKKIPLGSLVILVGPSGAGKSTLAREHFGEHEIVSSDGIRQDLFGDFTRQDKGDEIFREFERRIEWKLRNGYRCVADATHLRDADRLRTAEIGSSLNVPVIYLVFNRSIPEKQASAGWRATVVVGDGLSLIEKHEQTFVANEKKILAGDPGNKLGIKIAVVDARVDRFEVVEPLVRDSQMVVPELVRRGYEKIRVIGDVHGNLDGMLRVMNNPKTYNLFLGDIVDYGVDPLSTLNLVHEQLVQGVASNIRANHEVKIAKWVDWYTKVPPPGEEKKPYGGTIGHGNAVTVNQLLTLNPTDRAAWITRFRQTVEMSPDFIVIDVDRVYGFAHGAAVSEMYEHPRFRFPDNSPVWALAMFGEVVKNETVVGLDGNVYPKRSYNWVDTLPARYTSVVGHAVLSMEAPVIKTNPQGGQAIFLDTGSSKGGKLSYMDLKIIEEKKQFSFEVSYGNDD